MRIFVTGATGFIGTALVPELLAAGHQVLGLTRSEVGAASLAAAGAAVHHGSLEDIDSLQSGAAQSDGVIHLAFNHDFSKFVENSETDRRVIEALGAVLAGSDRPLIITSGVLSSEINGRAVTEEDPANSPLPRVASEHAADRLAASGVRVATMRLPQVHDPVKAGLITFLAAIAREKGFSAYVGDGRNVWAAAHISDVAPAYRLALENAKAGTRYHAVGEEGVPMRDIAESIGRGLNIPVVSLSPAEADAHFGWLGSLVGRDAPASSALTQKWLGWKPTGPGLIADLDKAEF